MVRSKSKWSWLTEPWLSVSWLRTLSSKHEERGGFSLLIVHEEHSTSYSAHTSILKLFLP